MMPIGLILTKTPELHELKPTFYSKGVSLAYTETSHGIAKNVSH